MLRRWLISAIIIVLTAVSGFLFWQANNLADPASKDKLVSREPVVSKPVASVPITINSDAATAFGGDTSTIPAAVITLQSALEKIRLNPTPTESDFAALKPLMTTLGYASAQSDGMSPDSKLFPWLNTKDVNYQMDNDIRISYAPPKVTVLEYGQPFLRVALTMESSRKIVGYNQYIKRTSTVNYFFIAPRGGTGWLLDKFNGTSTITGQ